MIAPDSKSHPIAGTALRWSVPYATMLLYVDARQKWPHGRLNPHEMAAVDYMRNNLGSAYCGLILTELRAAGVRL